MIYRIVLEFLSYIMRTLEWRKWYLSIPSSKYLVCWKWKARYLRFRDVLPFHLRPAPSQGASRVSRLYQLNPTPAQTRYLAWYRLRDTWLRHSGCESISRFYLSRIWVGLMLQIIVTPPTQPQINTKMTRPTTYPPPSKNQCQHCLSCDSSPILTKLKALFSSLL